jgi:hypothetical protein
VYESRNNYNKKDRTEGMKKKSSVAVEEETRLKLDSMGFRHESYDQIIRRLIKFYEDNQQPTTTTMKKKYQGNHSSNK